ncbi:MAG: PAS domain S-box protein [Proteobacteria bacterium]|nr:PAS domain S-box protein [Pseudomonadota bacterium]
MSEKSVKRTERVLVVEDEVIIGQDLKSRIQEMGYQVRGPVATAEEAVESVRRELPDLVLMDVILAGAMDGIEAAETIRSIAEIPIVFVTAYADEERIDRAKLTLPFGYLIKPFSDRDLKATVEMALYKGKIDAGKRRAEEARKLNEARLEVLYALSRMGRASQGEICDFALEQGVALTKSRYGYLSFLNDERGELDLCSWSGSVRELCDLHGRTMAYNIEGAGLWAEAFRRGQPVVTNDYDASDPGKNGLPSGHIPLKRHMSVPVFDDGRIVAVAGVADKEEPYDETDIRQLRLLMEGMWQLIQRRKSEDAARKFEFTANASRDFMTLINRDYVYEAANRAYRATIRNGHRDIVGKSVAEVWGRELFETVIQAYLDECFSGKVVRYESWFEFHGLGRGYYDVTYYPYFDETGRVTHAAVVTHETTAYKRAEEAIQRAKNTLDSIVRTIPDIVYRLDENGHITFISEAIRAYGYQTEALIGRDILELVDPEMRENARFHLKERRTRDRRTRSMELKLLTQDRGERYFEARYEPLDGDRYFDLAAEGLYGSKSTDSADFMGTQGIARDITDRKIAERELEGYRRRLEEMVAERTHELLETNESLQREIGERRSMAEALGANEKKYRLLAENARDIIFRMGLPEGDFEYISPAAEALTGYAPEAFYEDPGLLQKILHPDWNDFFESFWRSALAGDSVPEFEFQIVCRSGETRWMHQRNVLIQDEAGRPVALEGIVTDLTERKQVEDNLRKSESFNRSIIQSSRDCIKVLDLEGSLTFMSQSGQDMLEIRDIRPFLGMAYESFWDKDRDAARRSLEEALAGRPSGFRGYRPTESGRPRWWDVVITPIRDDRGEVEGLLAVSRDITDRRRVEEALRKSERDLRTLIEQAPVGILTIDTEGIVTDANPKSVELMGSPSREETIGLNVLTLPPLVESGLSRYFRNVLETGQPEDIQAQYTSIWGKTSHFRARLVPLFDLEGRQVGAIQILEDITRQKEAEAERRKLFQAVEDSPSSVVVTDLDGTIEYVNPKFSETTGYSRQEALGQNPRILKSGAQDPEVYRRLWETISSGGEWHGEFLNRKKNGEVFWEFASISPVKNEDGQVTHYVAVKEDITERKRTEEELRLAKEAAETASRAKTDFLANMSHEIRTPMNAILGMIDLTLQGYLDEEQRDNLATAKSSAKHLLHIINDILDLSKIEAGKVELDRVDFELDSLARSVLTTFEIQAANKGLALQLDLAGNLPVHIKGDPIRLRQILVNLIGNAVKFTDGGGVYIEIEPEPDSPPDRGTEAGVRLRFSVRDTGIGIPEEKRGTVFDTFSQAEAGITKKYGGTGLGLAICKQLVGMMGGRIWIESGGDRGSRFIFTAVFEPGDQSQDGFKDRDVRADATVRPLKILLAEDNPVNAKVATRFLARLGHATVVAEDGQAVLEALSLDWFDLVLMDVEMPEMDGIEATRRIRAGETGEANRNVPIVAMTAHALAEFRERCEEAGMNDYITKPVDFLRLGEVIQRNVPREPEGAGRDETASSESEMIELDERAVLDRIGGDEELLLELYAVFLDDAPDKIGRLELALDEGRLKDVERLAHGLKNTCGTLGAERGFRIGSQLEQAAAEERREEVEWLGRRFLREVEKLASLIKTRLPDNEK